MMSPYTVLGRVRVLTEVTDIALENTADRVESGMATIQDADYLRRLADRLRSIQADLKEVDYGA